MNQINIATESFVLCLSWIILNAASTIVNAFESESDGRDKLQLMFIFMRNAACGAIPCFFSIYLVNKQFLKDSTIQSDNLLSKLGSIGIEDFKIAMKSRLPAQYFKQFLQTNSNDHKIREFSCYENEDPSTSLTSKKSYKQGKTGTQKLGEVYFTLYQLI